MEIDPINDTLTRKLGNLADTRQASLRNASELQTMTRALLEHETLRVQARFGENHPRTKQLRARLDNSKSQIDTLVAEHERNQIQIPEVSTENTLLHGIVSDRDRRGVPRLMVCLTGNNERPVRELGEPSTDASGYFAFNLPPESIELLQSQYPDGVFVSVFSGDGETLVERQAKPVLLQPKDRVFLELTVERSRVLNLEPAEPPDDPETAIVPDVLGKTEPDAIEILTKARLKAGETQAQYVPDADQVGRVLIQDPQAGASVSVASTVILVIGASLLRVPNLVGLSLRDAASKLKEANFKLGAQSTKPVEENNQTGLIIAQSPDAGVMADQGTVVDIVIGIASSVKVPELVGLKSASARRKLRRSGLALGTVTKRVSDEPDVVLEQKPTAGVEVSVGSVVDIIVSEKQPDNG